MSKKTKKRVLLTVKLLVAAALLCWVFSKAHWDDYVQKPDGTTYTWLDHSEGGKQYVAETGLSTVLDSQADRKTYLFVPEEYSPAHDAPAVSTGQANWRARYVRPGLKTTLRDIHWGWFAIAFVSPGIAIAIASLRWRYLLAWLGIELSRWQGLRLGFLGQFFNMIVPGTVGGDVVKVWYVHQSSGKPAEVLVSVFVDRLMGMVELVMMAAIMLSAVLALGLESFGRMRQPIISLAVVASIAGGAMAFLLSSRLRGLFRLERFWRKTSVAHHFEAAGKSVRVLRDNPKVLGSMLLQTVVAHIFFVGGIALIGVAMGLNVPFYSYFVYLPLIYVIGAIPITPGGVGLIEGLYISFFCGAGGQVGPSQIIALAMLARLLPMIWSLLGLWVLVTGPKLPTPEDMQSELQRAEEEEVTSRS